MKRSIFILCLVYFALIPIALIQAQAPSLDGQDLNLTLTPNNPEPGSILSASVSAYVSDLNYANITWSINGKVVLSGVGEKNFSYNLPVQGGVVTVGVNVKTKEGQVMQASRSVTPASIDLIWQSEGFTPPFYRGKSEFSHQNKVTFVAIPHILGSGGTEISPKNLVYEWKKNGSVDSNASGFGKNTYTVQSPVISRAFEVSVTASAPSGNTSVIALASVSPQNPSIIFYKRDPLYGIEFQKALQGTVTMTNEQEVSVVAMPFFFGITSSSRGLVYDWKINGVSLGNESFVNSQTFRYPEGTAGTSNISVSAENPSKILQSVSKAFSLQFGSTAQ